MRGSSSSRPPSRADRDRDARTVCRRGHAGYAGTAGTRGTCVRIAARGVRARAEHVPLISEAVRERRWTNGSVGLAFSPGITDRIFKRPSAGSPHRHNDGEFTGVGRRATCARPFRCAAGTRRTIPRADFRHAFELRRGIAHVLSRATDVATSAISRRVSHRVKIAPATIPG